MFEDAMTYPEHIIKELKARVKELEEKNRRLEDRLIDYSWKEDAWREGQRQDEIARGGHGW